MFKIKLEEKWYKMGFKALPVKMQRSKNQQEEFKYDNNFWNWLKI